VGLIAKKLGFRQVFFVMNRHFLVKQKTFGFYNEI
jgi:hypothetical protein